MTPPKSNSHVDDNHASPPAVGPAPNETLPYPEWPTVVASLLDAFARLHATRRPAQGAAAPSPPTDPQPPGLATLKAVGTLLACVAESQHSPGLLEAAMVLHLRAVHQHNRRVRPDAPTQGAEGAHD